MYKKILSLMILFVLLLLAIFCSDEDRWRNPWDPDAKNYIGKRSLNLNASFDPVSEVINLTWDRADDLHGETMSG